MNVLNHVEFPSPPTVDTSSPCSFVLAGSTLYPAHLKTHNHPKRLTLRCEMLQIVRTFALQRSTTFDRRQTTTYLTAHCLTSSKTSSVLTCDLYMLEPDSDNLLLAPTWLPVAPHFLLPGTTVSSKDILHNQCSFFVFYRACRLCIIHFSCK